MPMECFWERGPQTSGDVLATLRAQRPIAHTTVTTTLARLYERGLVTRELEDDRKVPGAIRRAISHAARSCPVWWGHCVPIWRLITATGPRRWGCCSAWYARHIGGGTLRRRRHVAMSAYGLAHNLLQPFKREGFREVVIDRGGAGAALQLRRVVGGNQHGAGRR